MDLFMWLSITGFACPDPLLPFALSQLINDASQFVGPILLNRLLKVVANEEAPAWEGYMYAILMFAGTLAGTFADHQHFLRSNRAGMRLCAVLSAQVGQHLWIKWKPAPAGLHPP
jgi:hypothetical protein